MGRGGGTFSLVTPPGIAVRNSLPALAKKKKKKSRIQLSPGEPGTAARRAPGGGGEGRPPRASAPRTPPAPPTAARPGRPGARSARLSLGCARPPPPPPPLPPRRRPQSRAAGLLSGERLPRPSPASPSPPPGAGVEGPPGRLDGGPPSPGRPSGRPSFRPFLVAFPYSLLERFSLASLVCPAAVPPLPSSFFFPHPRRRRIPLRKRGGPRTGGGQLGLLKSWRGPGLLRPAPPPRHLPSAESRRGEGTGAPEGGEESERASERKREREREREKERQRDLPSNDSLPKWLQWPELS